MSKVRSDNITNRADDGAPKLVFGAEVPVGYGITGAGGINITGVATAASFSGNLTGNVTGTATGLSGSPNITINNLTGVAATFTGVLTYEDVTNVDSVGIITARSHVSIADSILHTGDTDTSIRFPAANTFTVETAGSERVRVDSSGRLLHGTTSSSFNISAVFQGNSDNSASAAGILLQRGTATPPDGQELGNIYFADSAAGTGALILGKRDGGTWSGSSKPGRLEFLTTPDGATSGNVRLTINSVGEVRVGSAFSVSQAGVCTAAEFHGDGSNLQNLPAAGISTEAFTSSGIVTAVRLSTAQDHKITATGFTTITSSGSGTEGESHTIRIVNSGIATVGFSTYFLFPSGAAPTMPTADGAISLISFTVHDSVGAGCTQLLAGASVNYS